MRRVASLLGGLVALLCLGFFLRALVRHWSDIGEISLGTQAYAGMAIALALYLATYLTGAKSWQLVLRSLEAAPGYRRALGILAVSQFGKYLPGNVGHHFGRVLLARRVGLRDEIVVTSIGLEAVLAVVSASAFALGALHLLPDLGERYGVALARNVAIAFAVVAMALLLALAMPRLRGHLGRAVRRCSELVAARNRQRTAMALLQYAASFVLGAAALGAIGMGLGAALPPFFTLVGVYAVAWLAGFLLPGAPAGLGVREALLVLGLSPMLGQEAATAATALFRVVTVAGDGLMFGLGWALAGTELRRPSATGQSRGDAAAPHFADAPDDQHKA